MRYVRKLTSQITHVCSEIDPYATICGKQYDSNVINEVIRLGYTSPKELPDHIRITCKSCLKKIKA